MTFDFETRREFAKKRFTAALTANAAFEAALEAGFQQMLLTGSATILTDGCGNASLVGALQAFADASNKIVEA